MEIYFNHQTFFLKNLRRQTQLDVTLKVSTSHMNLSAGALVYIVTCMYNITLTKLLYCTYSTHTRLGLYNEKSFQDTFYFLFESLSLEPLWKNLLEKVEGERFFLFLDRKPLC